MRCCSRHSPKSGRQPAPASPITYPAHRGSAGRALLPPSAAAPRAPRPAPRGDRAPRAPAPTLPRAKLPGTSGAAITLNGNEPRRSAQSRRPARVGMEPASSPGEGGNSTQTAIGGLRRAPGLRGFRRSPADGGARPWLPRRPPSGSGRERNKGLGLGGSSPKLRSQVANARSPRGSCGSAPGLAPGPRRPGRRRHAPAARGARARGAARLRRVSGWLARSAPAPRPPPLSGALPAPPAPPPPPPPPAGHAPAETRAVSWTAAPALPISAVRPEPRAPPDAPEPRGDPPRRPGPRGRPGRRGRGGLPKRRPDPCAAPLPGSPPPSRSGRRGWPGVGAFVVPPAS
ncbi:basic proline-rich protein-like [Dipodomys merriami]|uniref:basic proline-rich protein-like n=1 Tax=Dipodomys merriami TaxID=94247 RepID=UPI0038559AD5